MTKPARLGAAFILAPAVLVLAGGPALAADNVVITNAEIIQAHLNSNGTVRDARVYEQISLLGKGTVTIDNPVSTDNLRNLDGFGGFEVKDGKMVSTQTVDGESRLRAVSDFKKTLPLKIAVTYKLDGKTVQASDVVGRSGRLEVHYVVENMTSKAQDLTYDDGTGTMVTKSTEVVIPMVGSLSTVLPSTFLDVASDEANMAGDGRGATKLSFTMTLFGPIGSPKAEFGYAANITDGIIPNATISALPVSPLDSPSFKGGAASYKAGADTGITLTAGAGQIDQNVLKLRDGAQTLIAGLIQLRDGAKELNAGLSGEAAPGANALAAGATKLGAGAGELKAGLGQASAKAPDLIDGLDQVSGGLSQVDAGLLQMYGEIGTLPAEARPLHAGIQQMLTGLGRADTPANTLAYGVRQIQTGLTEATVTGGPLDRLKGGVDLSKGGVDQIKGTLDTKLASGGEIDELLGGVAAIRSGLGDSLAAGGSIDQLAGGLAAAKGTTGCLADPVCQGTLAAIMTSVNDGTVVGTLRSKTTLSFGGLGLVSTGLDELVAELTKAQGGLGQVSDGLGKVSPGLAELKTKLATAAAGLIRVECGLDNRAFVGAATDFCAVDADPKTAGVQKAPGLRQGLLLVDGGVSQLVSTVVSSVQAGVGVASDQPADLTLRGGVNGLQDGVGLIGAGGLTLVDGLGKLGAGAGLLSDGTTELSAGANKLAAGLGDAATGSGTLANGLSTAADGAKALPEGAAKLSAEGTSQLVVAGRSTAADYGLKYAQIAAGAERAKTEAMAYGAPTDAAGTTAYSLEIAGANGDGATSVGRGIAALALFGAGGGLALIRRRFV